MQEQISAGAAITPATSSIWRTEIAETVKLSWPMALTQLGQIAMMTSDLALLGRLGEHLSPPSRWRIPCCLPLL